MRYVYVLRSQQHPDRTYVGATGDLQRRISEHNAGKSRHTAKFAPWQLQVALRFRDAATADAFEGYLKTGSGRAFMKRHFVS